MRKLLLVEDEEMLREAYFRILSTEPYIVNKASNGKEALELCKENEYDLILLDLMMPIVDGVGFLEKFTENGRPKKTKVLLITNLSYGNELDKALSLGANKSVLKSDLSPKQLLATVRYEVESSV